MGIVVELARYELQSQRASVPYYIGKVAAYVYMKSVRLCGIYFCFSEGARCRCGYSYGIHADNFTTQFDCHRYAWTGPTTVANAMYASVYLS